MADAHKMELARRFLRDHKPQNCDDPSELVDWREECCDQFLLDGNRRKLTASMVARIELFLEDLAARQEHLTLQRYKDLFATESAAECAESLGPDGADTMLLGALIQAVDQAPHGSGFVYFKKWTMPDGSAWYKIGITNEPARRDAEQNVLPVAAETISCIDVGGMERARYLEAAIHATLDSQRITDANNRELFHLTPMQAAAVLALFRYINGDSLVVTQKGIAAQVLSEVKDPCITDDGGVTARGRAMELLTATGLSEGAAGLMLAAWLGGDHEVEGRLLDQMEAGERILLDRGEMP